MTYLLHKPKSRVAVILAASSLAYGQAAFPADADSLAASHSVGGADTDSPAADPEPRNRFIEEIVITAQKREENLQEVPISVQAFSAEALDARGIEEPKALQLSVPGLQYNIVGGYSLIYIRGVGTDAYLPSADASVATYVDNVYYPFGHGLASALGSIERVEVLKGPQGTLFGRNSTGGAINIVTRQPGPDFESSLQASRENYDKTNIRIFTNLPLSDQLSFSVSGLHYQEESYYRLAPSSPQKEAPDEISRAFSVKALYAPTEQLKAILSYSYINTRGAFPMSFVVDEVTPLGALAGVKRVPDYQTGEDAPRYINSVGRVASANFQYSAPSFDIRLIGSDQDIRSPGLADYDGSSAPLVTFEAIGQFADIQTAELQILSNGSSWGSDWLQWIGGLYHFKSSAGFDPILFTVAPGVISRFSNPQGGLLSQLGAATQPFQDLLQRIPVAAGSQNFVDPLTFLDNGISLGLEGVLDTNSTAAFFQTTAKLSESLALTFGGRYQTEKRELAKSRTNYVPNPTQPEQSITVINFGGRKANTSNFSPKAVLDYQFNDSSMGYLSYATGFKSGTYNIVAIYLPTQYIVPEKVTTYELGYKGTLLDGALRLNGAVFQNSIKNLQTQTISLTSGGGTRFETAGSARIRGADFDLLWQIAPDSLPGIALTAGGAILDGKYTSYREGSGYDEKTGLFFDGTVFQTRDFTGNDVVRTPKFSGNAGLSYTFDFSSSSLEISGDAYYNDGAYFTAQNTQTAREHHYTVINARISYFYEPWQTRIALFGKNITDAKYHYSIADLDFGTSKVLAPPVTYGLRVNWDF